uniref:NADH dehydrogenase subunit 5 n=1 Tax=Lagria rufipennis TaxID=1738060 RepID=UPI002176BF77|nr:NADH dehydrogenase subunit 5 [Lagria rufipennis]UUL71646.1 NADH dehydrogenase subunit 5 [Lagria rufipennis]
MNICMNYFFITLFLSIIMFFFSIYFLIFNKLVFIEFDLISLNSSSIMMTLYFDWMTFMFMSFVLYISSLIILYSKEYMKEEIFIKRFIFLVFLFIISMMLLIISPNLISILLGWDGLGLVSYCLVIYYQNNKSYNAGMLTALTNRIGDVAILLTIAWFLNFGSWNFMFYLSEIKQNENLWLISLFIVIAAMTKSAQIPFSSWLPAAMAAPTPVSSLVHSSTLVTAGVYLMIRFINSLSTNLLYTILLFSMITMFMSGLGATFEFDLKKIIALSTLSQLGLMFSILMLGSEMLAFFHLLTHALFKALLFMCAGNMIHNYLNCQDIRFMGNCMKTMPLTCTIFNISNLSLCGLPFLSGFYSKDLIMETMMMSYFNLFVYLVFFISIGFTACYTLRLFYYSCFSTFNFYSLNNMKDSMNNMMMSMIFLVFPAIMMGAFLNWIIFSSPYLIMLCMKMKFMTLTSTFSGMFIGFYLSKIDFKFKNFSLLFYKSSIFLSSLWNLPYLSTLMLTKNPLKMSNLLLTKIDQSWMENYSCQKIFNFLMNTSKIFQFFFQSNIKIFILLFILFLTMMF